MKIYILLTLSVLLCQCTGTSRRSADNKQTNPPNDGTAFWAARGKRNELAGFNVGVIRCGWVRAPEETDEEFSWPRLDDFDSIVPDLSLDTRFKRSAGRDAMMDFPSSSFQSLPSWWVRPSSHGNGDFLHRELAWLKLLGGKRSDSATGSGGNANTDSTSVPFWAARG